MSGAFLAAANAPGDAQAANIVFVRQDSQAAVAQPLVDFLTSEGHTLTVGAYTTGPPDAATLESHNLIVLARESNSGDYDEEGEPQAWNAVALPMLSLNAFVERGGTGGNLRWAWFDGNTRPALAGVTAFDPYLIPHHPFLAGVSGTTILNAPSTVDQQAISRAHMLPEGSTVIATLGTDTAYGLYEIPAGVESFGQGTIAGPRATFVIGSEGSFANATADARQILRNMIDVLASAGGVPGDVNGDEIADINDFNIIRDNFQQAGSREMGDLNGSGFVDLNDFRRWKLAAYPSGAAAGLGEAIPEPSSALLLLLALVFRGRTARERV